MPFGDNKRINGTTKVIDKIVHVPKYVEVIIEKPVLQEKIVQYEKPVYVDREIINPILRDVDVPVEKVKIIEVEKIVEVPVYTEVIVERPVYVEKEIIVNKYVEKIIDIPVEKIRWVEVVREIEVPHIVYKDIVVNRPKFRDVHVDVIKPHYKCQNCGEEV